jgi:ATP-dependent DNA ligase
VRLYTRNGHDLTARFPLVAALLARSCLIDGEAIVSDDSGLAVFGRSALRLRLARARRARTCAGCQSSSANERWPS